MLNVPAAPDFVPYLTAFVGAGVFVGMAVVWFIIRTRRPDKPYHEYRIVCVLVLVFATLIGWAYDGMAYETAYGEDIRTATEIERVYDIELDRVAVETLLEGQPVTVDGETYALKDDRLIVVEGWADVP